MYNNISLGKRELKLTSQDLIVTETNSSGVITFASRDFCKFAEYQKEELVGKNHNIVRHQFMPKVAFKDLWDTVEKKETWSGIVVNKTKNGNYYWVKANVYPSKYPDGTVKYISVRVMPSEQEILDAIALYKELNSTEHLNV